MQVTVFLDEWPYKEFQLLDRIRLIGQPHLLVSLKVLIWIESISVYC